MEKTCESCGRSFSIPPARANTARYCSKRCYGDGKMSSADHFWSRVAVGAPNDCWLWRGSVGGRNYGTLRFRDRDSYAHVVAWELTNGPVPKTTPLRTIVRHDCDTPLCCNPGHLRLGNDRDNAMDRDSRGRGVQGRPSSWTRRFTPEDVRAIRAAYAAGESLYSLRRRFGTGGRSMELLLKGVTYQDVH